MTLQELGQSLKEQREAAGISLEEISTQMKLSVRLLQSIEEGDASYMPHAVYTKRFIRSLGEVIGYDMGDLNTKLELIYPDESIDEETKADPGRLDMETVEYSGITPGVSHSNFNLLAVIIIVAAIVGGGWFVFTNYGDAIMKFFNFSTSSTPAPVQPVAQQAPQTGPPMQTAPVQNAAPSAYAQNPAPYQPQSLAPTSTPSTPLPAVASINQVLISASDECTVNVRADGAQAREYRLRSGESFVVTYTNNLDLALNNAGAISLMHNGKHLGKAGQGRQAVRLHFPMPGN